MLRRMCLAVCLAMPICALSSSGAPAQGFSPAAASTRLDDGMTIIQAENAVGYRPTSVQETTCGGGTANPWECRILTWGGPFPFHSELVAYFARVGNVWIINNWVVQ